MTQLLPELAARADGHTLVSRAFPFHVDPETDERALVAALRRHETHAFDALYRRYHPRIWAFLVRLTNNPSEAEDLFQETWLAAARHAHRLHPESEIVPWLFSIARNKFRSTRRFLLFDLRRKERFALEPLPEPLPPDEIAHLRARAAELERALESLSPMHREILVLTIIEGLDARQVAQVLGLREDATRKRLSRARSALESIVARARTSTLSRSGVCT